MDTHEFLLVLVSWAANLTSYPYPGTAPELARRPHAFFVEHACGGREDCGVVAWYNDEGTVYLDDRVEDIQDPVVRSVLVHEMVHYLQHLSGKFDLSRCEDRVTRERQAYSVQRIYLNRIAGRFGATWPVFEHCPAQPEGTP